MSGGFLKCDAAGCDHVENVPAIDRQYIGKPCPKCGADLLTEKDCEDWLAAIQPGIDYLKAIGLLVDKAPEGTTPDAVRIHLHEETLSLKPIRAQGES